MPRKKTTVEIDNYEFNRFYDRLLEKLKLEMFKKGVPEPRKLTVVQTCEKLREYIKKTPSVIHYINMLNGGQPNTLTGTFEVETRNNLYGNLRKVAKTGKVAINSDQLACFLLFYSDGKIKDWASYLTSVSGSRKNYTEYKGFFYSFYKHKILSFSLWIDFSENDPEKEMYVEEQGFHTDPYDKIAFKGNARRKNNYLFMDLTAKREDYIDELKFIAYVGNIPSPNLMLALFLGTSSYGYPTSGDTVLMKKELLTTADESIIRKYLMLKRSRIRVKNENYTDAAALRVKKQPVSLVEDMVGSYWVWNFNSKGDIIQSKFVIEDDYTSRFYAIDYGPNERTQVCLLSISNVISRRLCMSVHPNEGTGIISYVILSVDIDKKGITTGSFCAVGRSIEGPVNGKIVLLKASPSDDIIPICIDRNDIDNTIASDQRFAELYVKLKKVNKMEE